MALLIIISILLLLLAFLMVTPLVLKVDTIRGDYFLKMTGLFKISVIPGSESLPHIRLRFFFFSYELDPLKLAQKVNKKQGKKKREKEKKKRKKPPSVKGMPGKLRRVLASFHVKQFHLDLDTGDPILNGYLYPVFFFLNGGNRKTSINYFGRNELVIVIENRMYHILYAFIK